MAITDVLIVHLRQPTRKSDEMRSDPFWEFGSFGITGCHAKNLLNPRNEERLAGCRLAFAQGGNDGMRLVYLTPPVKVLNHNGLIEAKWTPLQMPFRYSKAPILARNPDYSDFRKLEQLLSNGNRSTIEAQFSSNFRSRITPLDWELNEELTDIYKTMRTRVSADWIASSYEQALHRPPPHVDRNRNKTYTELLGKAGRQFKKHC